MAHSCDDEGMNKLCIPQVLHSLNKLILAVDKAARQMSKDLQQSIYAVCICQPLLIFLGVLHQDGQQFCSRLFIAVKFSRAQPAQDPFEQLASFKHHLSNLRAEFR